MSNEILAVRPSIIELRKLVELALEPAWRAGLDIVQILRGAEKAPWVDSNYVNDEKLTSALEDIEAELDDVTIEQKWSVWQKKKTKIEGRVAAQIAQRRHNRKKPVTPPSEHYLEDVASLEKALGKRAALHLACLQGYEEWYDFHDHRVRLMVQVFEFLKRSIGQEASSGTKRPSEQTDGPSKRIRSDTQQPSNDSQEQTPEVGTSPKHSDENLRKDLVTEAICISGKPFCDHGESFWPGMWFLDPIDLVPGSLSTDLQISSSHSAEHPLIRPVKIRTETGERVEMAYITQRKIPGSESSVLLYQLYGQTGIASVQGRENDFVSTSGWMCFNMPLHAVPNAALRESIENSDIWKKEKKVLSKSACIILMLPIIPEREKVGPYCYLQCVVPSADARFPKLTM